MNKNLFIPNGIAKDDKSVLQVYILQMDYLQEMGLGGVMVWSLDLDDFKGVCGPPYPLVRSVRAALSAGTQQNSHLYSLHIFIKNNAGLHQL